MNFGKLITSFRRKEPKQKGFFLAGVVFLALAVVGVFLPIVPQVPFAILAAFFFSKSSPKLHKWIRNNRYLGPPVKHWEDDGVIRPKLKAVSTIAMVGGAAIGHFKLDAEWAYGLDAVFLGCILFVLTRPSKKPRARR